MSIEPSPPKPEIEALLAENRTFPPSAAFAAQANAKKDLYDEAEKDFEAFWARVARERVDWAEPFTTTLEWDLPDPLVDIRIIRDDNRSRCGILGARTRALIVKR